MLAGVALLAGMCRSATARSDRAFKDVNVVDESNLNDIMLTVADPNEAVPTSTRTLEDNPDRIDLQRGLGQSLIGQAPAEAVPVYAKM